MFPPSTPLARSEFFWNSYALVSTELSRGGRIEQRHDAARRLVETAVSSDSSTNQWEPQQVGQDTARLRKTFEYDGQDELIARSTDGARTEYRYNARRELLAVVEGQDEQRFVVDGAGNYQSAEPGQGSVFEKGNRLVRRGDTHYVYDSAGQLIEKRTSSSDGAERVFRYEWDGFKSLRAVETPDGRRVEFLYDNYARRVSKKVLRHEALGDVVESHTHYLWDRVALLQEVDVLGPEPVVRRSYGYLEQGDEVPAGHINGPDGEWVHYLTDHNGTPEQLLDAAGQVIGELEREVFGRVIRATGETTPIRFPGQYADEETGLHYNRYRYYDPEAGRYISPDPINLTGGVNLYAYGPNPIGWFDPMGWEHTMTVSVLSGLTGEAKKAFDGKVLSSGMGEDCPDHLKSQARCHTERKFGDLVRQQTQGGKFGDDVAFKLEGGLPPCPNCHRAMQKLADDCGGTYTYEYGDGQSVTYKGNTDPQFTDEELEEAYAMSPIDKKAPVSRYITDDMSPEQKQHIQDSLDLGYKFDNWKNATSGYTAAKP